MRREAFGVTKKGESAWLYSLENRQGLKAQGAIGMESGEGIGRDVRREKNAKEGKIHKSLAELIAFWLLPST